MAAQKGKTKQGQADAANKAAADALSKGRKVQKIVSSTTKAAANPVVTVKVSDSSSPEKLTPTAIPEPKSSPKKRSKTTDLADPAQSAGMMVMNAIIHKKAAPVKAKASHLEMLVQGTAQSAAQQAALKVAHLGRKVAKTAAIRAAKLAAKSAVLSEVRKAAAAAANQAKHNIKSGDVQAQATAASQAATLAAQNVLGIAKRVVERVARTATRDAVNQLQRSKTSKQAERKAE